MKYSIASIMLSLMLCVSLFSYPSESNGATPIKVAAVGDSITWGGGASDRALYSYPAVLQGLLGPDYVVNNYGVSSSTMLKKGNLPYWNQAAFTNSTSWQPDIVIIMLGSNDSKPANWQYESEYLSNYVEMINHYKNLASQPEVYVALSPYVNGTGYGGITNSVVSGEVVPLARQAAALTGAKIINNNAATEHMPHNFFDNVHPNDGGYNVIAHNVYNVLSFAPDTTYHIVNRKSGKVLDVNGASTQNGSNVIQWGISGGSSQKWKLVEAGTGYYKLINVNSNQMLDVTGGSTAYGVSLIQWPSHTGYNQQWEVLSVGKGYNRIVSRSSGKEVDVYGGSTVNGTQVIQWNYTGGSNQQWSLVQVP